MNKAKFFIYSIFFLVILSIFLSSYLDKSNNLKDEAIKFSDIETCKLIEHDFIRNDCIEIVLRKKKLIKNCEESKDDSKKCYNLIR